MNAPHRYPTELIESMLLPRIEELAMRLAPGGRREGAEWKALNPTRADHSLGSFSINLHSGKWADFSEGAASNKAFPCLSLVAYLATAGDFGKAILWAKDYLGLTGKVPERAIAAAANEEAKAARAARDIEEAALGERKRRAAHRIWLEGKELSGDDPGSDYLLGRGIDLFKLPAIPGCLRYNPRVKVATLTGEPHPAIVAAMHKEGAPDGFAAVHCTYLSVTERGWTKAFGKASKKILGAKAGASIRLTKGASGKPLAKAPAGEWVAIAEGIENGLSAALVKPELRILAAATLENIGKVVLPPQIGGVFVIADNDRPGSAAESALENACNMLVDRGLDIRIIRAPKGFKDFNDALTGKEMAL